MADANISNDEKQVIELKLVSLIHVIALRKSISSHIILQNINFLLGCLPNPDKNESVLKAFAVYAIKNHKQSLSNTKESSILSIFKQAISDGIKAKEAYALAV
jgi:PBP1b-binding outer membrane lipoprotein LpoB